MAISIEIEGVRLFDSSVQKLYFATDGFHTTPNDVPPRQFFEPRLRAAPQLARVMFDSVGTSGASRASLGNVELVNEDGALDELLTGWAFDGRRMVVRSGMPSAQHSSWPVIMTATLSGVQSSGTALSLDIRDRLVDLDTWDRPQYAGDNVAPNGLEGTPDDLKGQPKPWLFGRGLNITAKAVNTSKLIYEVSARPCTVTRVLDNGKDLTVGAPYATQADLLATTPTAGQARAYQGYIRLGSMPVGPITVYAETAEKTAAGLLREIAVLAGIPLSDLSDDVLPGTAVVGVLADGDTTPRALMDAIAGSVGAWYGFDRQSRLRMLRVDAPTGSALETWGLSEQLALQVAGISTPAWRVSVRYARNYTVQASTAALADLTQQAWAAQEYRTVDAKDETIKTLYPNALDLIFNTVLTDPLDAQAEADRLFAMYRVPRSRVDVEIPAVALGEADLGTVNGLDTDRFGLAGKPLLTVGLDSGFASGRAKLVLWG